MPSQQANQPADPEHAAGWGSAVARLLLLAVVLGAFAFLYVEYGDKLNLETIARHEQRLVEFHDAHPVAIYAAAFGLYVVVTGLSLPGATVLTVAYGWFFALLCGNVAGPVVAVGLVSFASTSGATLAFLTSRYVLREAIQKRFGERLRKFDAALKQEGAWYLFTLRLVPVPFFLVNLLMGLTPIRVWTFWWVSQIGMLAGTCVYVYAGSTIPSLHQLAVEGIGGIFTPQLITAFIILGLFPLTVKKLMERFGRRAARRELADGDDDSSRAE